MKTTLVGYTGFVGGNLAREHDFDRLYNSKNIGEAFETEQGLVVYSGVRAEKFLANSDPDADRKIIENAIDNIRRMKPEKLVLISTIDVYGNPKGVDEATPIDTDGLQAYGRNRYMLERWVSENIEDFHIVRLPGLFGRGLKKNFIYDMITLVPEMLKEDKYGLLCEQSRLVADSYVKAPNGFYKLVADEKKRALLREFFETNEFNSLKFTDSRAVYQFYNLENLWHDINIVIENGIRLQNISSEPVSASEIYKFVNGGEFVNEISSSPVFYDWRSLYADRYSGKDGYIYDKMTILSEIKDRIRQGI
ncbi:MAG: NAD(P)-dependent oxidoreductase [Oscillospiraceae bacterium]